MILRMLNLSHKQIFKLMIRILKNVLITVISILIISCQGQPANKENINNSETLKIDKSLSPVKKAKNTYQNTTCIFSGIMILAFSEMFEGTMQSFSKSLSGNVDSIDASISKMDEKLSTQIDTIIISLDKVFDEVLTEDKAIYKKLFTKSVLSEGVEIATKYELPEGYRPLTQNLTTQEIKRYIVYVLSEPETQETDDPIIKTFTELTEWLKRVDAELKADPEINDFLNSIR